MEFLQRFAESGIKGIHGAVTLCSHLESQPPVTHRNRGLAGG